jgi:hypothetical protein
LQSSGQFLAIGTYSTPPYVRDLTNSPNLTWISSFSNDFPVSTNTGGNSGASAGIVTAYATGSVTIIAEAKNPGDGTIQTATAQFNCPLVQPSAGTPATPTTPATPPTAGSCFPGSQAPGLLQTLTVYNEGLNTTNWLVTAPSATGTANVLHCGPGWVPPLGNTGSVCTATYPLGATVLLTATGGAFGGWSYNCRPSDQTGAPLLAPPFWTATGPNYCTFTFTPPSPNVDANTNVTVGAIFNNTTNN